MRVVLLVLIVLWPATAQARWVGTAEQWADLQSRDAYGDMGNWFNSLSSKKAGSCCSNFDGRPPEAIVQTSHHHSKSCLRASGSTFPTMPCSTCRISMARRSSGTARVGAAR
jgi:hypothetical protein